MNHPVAISKLFNSSGMTCYSAVLYLLTTILFSNTFCDIILLYNLTMSEGALQPWRPETHHFIFQY